MRAEIDGSEPPIVRIVMPSQMSLGDIDAMGEDLHRLFEVIGPCYGITDASRLETMTSKERAHISRVVDEIAARGAILSEAIYVPSPLARGIAIAYSWLRRRANHPLRCFATMDEAMAWTLELKRAAEARSSSGTA